MTAFDTDIGLTIPQKQKIVFTRRRHIVRVPTLKLSFIKTLKTAANTTVNDIIYAATAGAETIPPPSPLFPPSHHPTPLHPIRRLPPPPHRTRGPPHPSPKLGRQGKSARVAPRGASAAGGRPRPGHAQQV